MKNNKLLIACLLLGPWSPISAADGLMAIEKKQLAGLPYEGAKKLLRLKRIIYIDNPKYSDPPQGELRQDLYQEATYYFAKNPNVRRHCEHFFATTPHTLSTGRERSKAFGALLDLRAEWVARLLIKEALIDREHQEFNNDPHPPLTEDEIFSRFKNNNLGDVVRNDARAALHLYRFDLEGMEAIGKGGTKPNSRLDRMRQWIEQNQHRLPELLVKRWGDKAVLNKDMQRHEGGGKLKTGIRKPERLNEKSEAERIKTNTRTPEGGIVKTPKRQVLWGVVATIILLSGYYFLSKYRKRRN